MPQDSRPIYIINGPNLNRLGAREQEHYGSATLGDIEKSLQAAAKDCGAQIKFFQSNEEGELVTLIQEAADKAGGVIVNAGAYTHTSVALLDALKLVSVPVVEVHLSNIFARETFRHRSFVSPAASGVICGFGADGYVMALRSILG